MPAPSARAVHAWLDSLLSGVVDFDRDWPAAGAPRLTLGPGSPPLAGLAPAPAWVAAAAYGYCRISPKEFAFVLPLKHGSPVDPARDRLYVGGDFNGWQKAVGAEEWELKPDEFGGEAVLMWRGPPEKIRSAAPARFKFVTGEHQWLAVPNDAPNPATDEHGNINRLLDPARTGRHLWRFTVERPFDLSQAFTLQSEGADPIPLGLGDFFYELSTDLPLGARIEGGVTCFRLFAPRAQRVTVYFCAELAAQGEATAVRLARRSDSHGAAGAWEATIERPLDGWFYWYTLDGAPRGPDGFDPNRKVLDPYALATVGPAGPGIVLAPARLPPADRSFRTPAWQDLIIAEAHVRDLTAHAPIGAGPVERRGFTGLREWVDSAGFYLHALGVNAVELQPVQQSDTAAAETYQWGYMTANFFAPDAGYALAPAQATGVGELRDLIAAFHRRGQAVLLDVVFNHVGLPAHLMAIDRLYYFEFDGEGRLSNWSGVGNDLRARSAMARRLIIDACVHLLEFYGADGFRFDLAELLGVDVLRQIEVALKRVKPDVILIAEPWSFRGHIAGALRDTGWASWNDGYRDFIRDYVLGRGEAARLEYYLRGSPWYFAKWPAQTINYTQSHDDRAWIDTITENPGHDGWVPTVNDRRRTHLMAAALFLSLGVPMLAEGQDFFWSKRGENNTYQRGDLNALEYQRLYRQLATHAYFAEWIHLRRGPLGRLLRQFSRPSEGFFRFFHGGDGKALAVLFNADGSQGRERLLFAINPLLSDALLAIGPEVPALGVWRQRADQDRFYPISGHGAQLPVEPELTLPGLSCSLWNTVVN